MSALRERHESYLDMQSRWELCDALFEGEHGIHEAGEKYLPKLQDEDDKAYQARLLMTPVFGAFPRTVLGLRGMMFRKPMKVEVPALIAPMMNDIDLAGTTLQGLAQAVVGASLVKGRIGLLVDYPQTIPGATKADAAALNYRPLIARYDAEAIYNWRLERINGVIVTSHVRLEEKEIVQDPKDEFKTTTEKRCRILDLFQGKYRQRIFSVKGKGAEAEEILIDEFFPMMNGKPLTYIPFVGIGVDCIGLDVEAPPLIDLATTVWHHYLQATSYERGCFFSGLPTMFISGQNDTNADGTPLSISIGGNLANILTRPDAKAYYVEVLGDFEALRTNLEDKKREMAVLGARMLETQKTGVESAEAIARRTTGEEALLSIMAQTVSAGLTQALQWFADWAGVTGEVKVELNRDFLPAGLTAQDMTALIAAWQNGAVSSETLFDNLKAGEIIDADTTYEIEQERIAGTMVGGMTPPIEDQPAPIDSETISAMITAAINDALANMPQPEQNVPQPIDMQPIADAIAAMPAPVVNITPAAAPTINITPAPINVAAPTIVLPEQQAPVVNVSPPAITVEGSTINMPDQPITINAPPANVTVNNMPPDGKKMITVERDANGIITGATTA